tara:strand:- start:56 stop:334 length:279 start_codon:yes stop_codon:yes gene_type:complete
MGKATDEFDAAIQSVTQDRGRDYGHPKDTFANIAALQCVVRSCPNPAIRHALEMICVKLVRLTVTPDHMDSVIDIAGYARTIAMIIDKGAEG